MFRIMDIDLNKLREQIQTETGRQKILNEINDLAFLGPVGETKQRLEQTLRNR